MVRRNSENGEIEVVWECAEDDVRRILRMEPPRRKKDVKEG